jgi:hypothetical protein
MKIDIIVTRHAPLLRFLRELGLADESTTVLEHVSISDITGKHVAGVLPVSMAAHTASYTEIPMALTPADRIAIQAGDLSDERMREIASPPVTYYVSTERTWPCVAVFAAACRHAAPWSTFYVKSIGPGTLELESAEGTDWAQVDMYSDRYRCMSMGGEWSVWLDEHGERHRNQGAPVT